MKVLLVSDNKQDWEIIRKLLKANYKDLQLVCAINKTDAITAVTNDGPFGFLMLDCNIKDYDPNEIGFALIEIAGERPIIFLGQESMITDRISQELYSLNEYNDQIHHPLEREDLLTEFKGKVNQALNWAKEEEFEQSLEEVNPEDFLPMKLRAFYLYRIFPFDIYLAITTKNYIRIISADKPYTHSTLATYARKNIKFLYIRKDDQLRYLEDESMKCIKSLKTMEVSHQDIFLMQIRAVTILHQYILALGVSPSVLTLMNAVIESILKVAKYGIDFSTFIQRYPTTYPGIPSKSIMTGYISYFIARKLEWDSTLTQSKLVICAILQDISLPDDNLTKINQVNSPKLKNFKEEEMNAFFNHPTQAASYAKQFSSYSDIDYIVESHHELPNRKGFPNRPSSSKLTQICAVFNISQYIAGEIDGLSADNQLFHKTIKAMAKDYGIGSFKEIYKHLKSILRMKSKN